MDYKREGWVHGTALSWAVFFAIVNMNKQILVIRLLHRGDGMCHPEGGGAL